MAQLSLSDNGVMAAVFGPLGRVGEVLAQVDGFAVIANINSNKECVIGGATAAMDLATQALRAAGMRVTQLPVSHAFHTSIVAAAAVPLKQVLSELQVGLPRLPVIANVTGEFYPTEDASPATVIEMLGQQVGSPVQFVKGLESLYAAGARVFIEMGPKRVLHGLVEDVLGDREHVTSLFTNHPRTGDVVTVNRALCGLYALGLGAGREAEDGISVATSAAVTASATAAAVAPTREAPAGAAAVAPAMGAAVATAASAPVVVAQPAGQVAPAPAVTQTATAPARQQVGGQTGGRAGDERVFALGRMFADVLERGMALYGGGRAAAPRIGITGASIGLPGTERIFDDANLERILGGEVFIKQIPQEIRQAMAGRGITRLVKGAGGEAGFEVIDDPADVIKLSGRSGTLDLAGEYGYPEDRLIALDRVTQIAIAAGIDALRDAGIPLVQRFKTTTTGSRLPVGWGLPDELRDETGVIFASAFPSLDNFARIIEDYHHHRQRTGRLEELCSLRERVSDAAVHAQLDARIAELQADIDAHPYHFDRRFLFQVLNMGHSQFAEYIGARGPNVATNGACASGTQAVGIARDWIETGRCRRVIIVTADDITTDTLLPWFGSGFLASGAAATDERVEDAALPFDRRRHGLIIGSGGAALVVETLEAAAERGVRPIVEVLGTIFANSAFHGSRLDVNHIAGLMEQLVSDVERRWQLDRYAIARDAVFVSHETYTPARGGSASAEVVALRTVFGAAADSIIVANTKGFTGHPMAVAMEDAIAVKMLGDRHHSAGSEFPRGGPRAGHAQPVARRQPSSSLRAPAGCGLRLADLHDAARVAAAGGWRAPLAARPGLPAPHLRRAAVARLAAARERRDVPGAGADPAHAACACNRRDP
jgi:3-oxoacyl-(acyl-carrier-protein) synthase